MDLIIFLLIGALAGWLAGVIMKGGGFGLIGDIVVGVLGSFLGGWWRFRWLHHRRHRRRDPAVHRSSDQEVSLLRLHKSRLRAAFL